MARLIVRRVLLLVPVLLGLSVLLFAWVRALPGSPADALLGDRATPEARAEFDRIYGLDQPLPAQYLSWLARAVRLDFGNSLETHRSVLTEFLARFPATVELAGAALVFAIGVGVPLGYFAATRAGGWLDTASTVSSLAGITVPVFFLAFLLKYLFAVAVPLFPPSGRLSPWLDGTPHPTGFYLLDGLIGGDPLATWDAVQHLVLPGIALGSIPLAVITRITRASVAEVLGEDYVRTAVAKGLSPRTLRLRHVLRNALLPVTTSIGLMAGLLLSGAVLTETVFAYPGIGRFLYDAINNRDYAVIQGFTLLTAVVYTMINALVDISYGVIDPRVRVS
ncbi:ABC transporter permease [Nonomuraea sp. NPDC050153]|uniref:ABC transporter permease n=1 Tax=Nonomuraea sp. NPDC050153 TaxID=3364359 RepID=UPI0037B2A4EE